jgi:disulfide bond formation protein DsbB
MNASIDSRASRRWLGVAAAQAVVAMLGSLYFSLIAGYTPCELCWYQRICMYPLAIILPIAFFTREKATFLRYVTPLILVGICIAAYHNGIYYASMYRQLHPSTFVTTCVVSGPDSCTTRYIDWFGFVTIPLLSFIAFTVISVALLAYRRILRGLSSL